MWRLPVAVPRRWRSTRARFKLSVYHLFSCAVPHLAYRYHFTDQCFAPFERGRADRLCMTILRCAGTAMRKPRARRHGACRFHDAPSTCTHQYHPYQCHPRASLTFGPSASLHRVRVYYYSYSGAMSHEVSVDDNTPTPCCPLARTSCPNETMAISVRAFCSLESSSHVYVSIT